MKKYVLLFLLSLFLFSCKEREPAILGKWVLMDGQLYMENLRTYEKKRYNHFDSGKTVSSLDIDGANDQFEVIHKGKTSWYFDINDFILNDTTTYELIYERYSIRIITGRAQIIQVLENKNGILKVKTGEKVESYNGDNYTYYSLLTLNKTK